MRDGLTVCPGKSIPLTGFHPCEIPVEEYAAVRFDTDFEFYDKIHLNLKSNIALAASHRGKMVIITWRIRPWNRVYVNYRSNGGRFHARNE